MTAPTREQVIAWAREAGFDPGTPAVVDWLSRFATIVYSAVRSEAVAEEREKCILDVVTNWGNSTSLIAAAIRARGESMCKISKEAA